MKPASSPLHAYIAFYDELRKETHAFVSFAGVLSISDVWSRQCGDLCALRVKRASTLDVHKKASLRRSQTSIPSGAVSAEIKRDKDVGQL